MHVWRRRSVDGGPRVGAFRGWRTPWPLAANDGGLLKRVDALLRRASGNVFTAAVARIEYRGENVFERAYGWTRGDRRRQPIFVDTRFDLASLTKIFISTLALAAVAQGDLPLDESLVPWFPQWRDTPRAAITLRDLLAHDSGMHSGADYRVLLDRDIIEFTLERELAAPVRERVIYSDLGFITLGELLSRRAGTDLQTVLARGADAVGRATVAYRPHPRMWPAIPATEDDGWRGRVQGFVHDEKAYLLGGVAGHAGLFGSAAGVARLSQTYLAPLCGRVTLSGLPHQLIEAATSEQAPDAILRRGLGWALKTSDENSCGRHFSANTFGHTGFVGTCVWADPKRDVLGVLLTNSVYFGRSDTRDLRAAFYEGLIEDLGLT
ncbi:MAG: beta-lactamase family protein [Candidatus Eremiobacteraeota bacterium]|nr:beta-lactamase family protein [Candidatus Eremiobacteraeota bacterium]